MNLDHIPAVLKLWPNFVAWKYVVRNGETTKPPVNAKTGELANSADSDTWGSYDEALTFFQKHKNNSIEGIGFEFGNSPYVGVDLDNCRDAETGKIQPWAQEIITKLDSYTEISPSGEGAHILVIGKLPDGGRRKGNIEMYSEGRYFTLTGTHLDGTPFTIEQRNGVLSEIHAKYIGQEPQPKASATQCIPSVLPDDEELLKKARSATNGSKFQRLWEGNHSDYPSQSEADMGLCLDLAFWTGKDTERIDRLFRQSGLMRDKWDKKHGRDTYGNITIKKAIEKTKDVYSAKVVKNLLPICNAPSSERAAEQCIDRLQFPDVMSGLAGKFSEAYSAVLEVPPHFFYMGFLTCLGNIIADKVSVDSELRPSPRLYTLLLGQSADDRKSTAVSKVIAFFKDALTDFNVCWGVGSAEGLQERLNEGNKLVLCFDEFKQFVGKCRIESSVLLPCVNTLFENTWYESHVKGKSFRLPNVHLSLLAASTVDTYEKTWDPAFTDIGFGNRLFLVPGQGERKFAFPLKVNDETKDELKERLGAILKTVSEGLELKLTEEARSLYEHWYLERDQVSIHSRRLDTYAVRLMMLLAVNDFRHKVDAEIVKKATALCDWQYRVRQLHDPIDADNRMAVMEEKIRRVLKARGPLTERELRQLTNAERTGQWIFNQARQNLASAAEIRFDGKVKNWAYVG